MLLSYRQYVALALGSYGVFVVKFLSVVNIVSNERRRGGVPQTPRILSATCSSVIVTVVCALLSSGRVSSEHSIFSLHSTSSVARNFGSGG